MTYLTTLGQYLQSHVLGVIFAILATYAIGFLWHGPLFGKQWMELNKIPMPKKEDMKFSMMLPGLSANLFFVLVESAVLGWIFGITNPASIGEAMILGTILWLPFTALAIVNNYAWVGRPVKLMLLDTGYYLVSIWAVAAILYTTR